MENPPTSRDYFNSSNLFMPPSRLIYSLDHLASSLSKWLRTKDHEFSPTPNKATIARYPQCFQWNHECMDKIDPTSA